jgi:hypothetical protein
LNPASTHEPVDAATALMLARAHRRVLESRVAGRSMGQAIPEGTRIRIDCAPRQFSTGDVITYARDGALITHRVIHCRGGWLIARGDATIVCDIPIHSGEVVGHVVSLAHGVEWRPVPALLPPTGWRRVASSFLVTMMKGLMTIHARSAAAAVARGALKCAQLLRRARSAAA